MSQPGADCEYFDPETGHWWDARVFEHLVGRDAVVIHFRDGRGAGAKRVVSSDGSVMSVTVEEGAYGRLRPPQPIERGFSWTGSLRVTPEQVENLTVSSQIAGQPNTVSSRHLELHLEARVRTGDHVVIPFTLSALRSGGKRADQHPIQMRSAKLLVLSAQEKALGKVSAEQEDDVVVDMKPDIVKDKKDGIVVYKLSDGGVELGRFDSIKASASEAGWGERRMKGVIGRGQLHNGVYWSYSSEIPAARAKEIPAARAKRSFTVVYKTQFHCCVSSDGSVMSVTGGPALAAHSVGDPSAPDRAVVYKLPRVRPLREGVDCADGTGRGMPSPLARTHAPSAHCTRAPRWLARARAPARPLRVPCWAGSPLAGPQAQAQARAHMHTAAGRGQALTVREGVDSGFGQQEGQPLPHTV